MTDTAIDLTSADGGRWQPPKPRTNPDCPAEMHGGVIAYTKGCTCRESFTAYRSKMNRQRTVPAAVDESGQCIATRHDTWRAYAYQGCRCPTGLDAHKARLESQRQSRERHPVRGIRAPRNGGWSRRWRGPDTRVSRISVSMAMAGFPAGCTRRELMLAAIQLSRTGNRYGSGLLTTEEIAERLQINRNKLQALLAMPADLAAQRTRRRLADVRARAAWKKGKGR